jgi:hypothetical protein
MWSWERKAVHSRILPAEGTATLSDIDAMTRAFRAAHLQVIATVFASLLSACSLDYCSSQPLAPRSMIARAWDVVGDVSCHHATHVISRLFIGDGSSHGPTIDASLFA